MQCGRGSFFFSRTLQNSRPRMPFWGEVQSASATASVYRVKVWQWSANWWPTTLRLLNILLARRDCIQSYVFPILNMRKQNRVQTLTASTKSRVRVTASLEAKRKNACNSWLTRYRVCAWETSQQYNQSSSAAWYISRTLKDQTKAQATKHSLFCLALRIGNPELDQSPCWNH